MLKADFELRQSDIVFANIFFAPPCDVVVVQIRPHGAEKFKLSIHRLKLLRQTLQVEKEGRVRVLPTGSNLGGKRR
jgi:hypothetical protein